MRKMVAIEGGWCSGKTTLLNAIDSYTVLPTVVPQIYDLIGRESNVGPDKDPETFSELFFLLRSRELEKISRIDGPPILCDRTLFAPIALRRFNNICVPDHYYTAIERMRNDGILHSTVFFAEQIPFNKLAKGWPKRRFLYDQAARYSKITEELIESMRFQIKKISFGSLSERKKNFEDLLEQEDFSENILLPDKNSVKL